MKNMRMSIARMGLMMGAFAALVGCQDMDRPELGNYPVDENPVGGPLKFYVPFDMDSEDPLMIAVDQIRAKFPTENNFTTTAGVTENGVQGVADAMINYSKPNDWAATADSFTVAFWEKHDGQTRNGANPGAEHIFSIPSSNGHWSGGTMMLLFDAYGGSATAAAVKFVMVDADMADTWMTWENADSIEGLLDNQWHHFAFSYDASTSTMTLYIDGAVHGTKTWGTHGGVNLDDSKVTGFRIGHGPQAQNGAGDNWLSSSWKGSLDQFRLYSTALTAAEVQDLFANQQ
ncbi:LamG domain-containing protein [Flavobacterium selenitireducens]|uniref:LamG domain-containing protein n=1 Tax=Flavobacterium selenitireducens TaxID=2722704 RepID=UPI00168B863A|nr:LamG domain-containing protein [Flavobacterium selenitireducens]MBD3582904.1 LamG domain-containing protein [Flavobacterium selenitireducens]